MIIELADCRTPACIERGDTKHRVVWDMPTVQELLRIQKTLGMTAAEWEDALNGMADMSARSLEAMLMLVQLVHGRLGVPVAFDEIDFRGPDLHFLPDPTVEPEGKAETPGSPHPDDGPASTSGTPARAGSKARSSTTPPTSGGTSGSPP